jgi:glucose/arabinose dehydrogenase
MEGGAVATAPILAAEGADDMRRMVVRSVLVTSIVGAVVPTAGPAFAARAVRVAAGLNAPVGFTFSPTGRLFYLERHTGWLRIRNLQTDFDRRIYRITNVNSTGERGALGVALHPMWPDRSFVYAFATRNTPSGLRNQVLRIKLDAGHATRVRTILSAAAGPASNHNGGRILFGPDGKLYVVIGDNARPSNAQDRTSNLRGKILRVNPDGSIPATNPFGRIWAYGIRNSLGFAFDPRTGRLWEQDNGPSCNDEVNRIVKGGNHAWGPNHDCSSGTSPTNTNNSGPLPRILPRHTFVDPKGLTGVAFCTACGLGPAVNGDILVGAVNDGIIRRFDLNAKRKGFAGGPIQVLDRPGPVISLEVGPNGRIYFSDFGAVYRLAA